jgi:hypothetical protein
MRRPQLPQMAVVTRTMPMSGMAADLSLAGGEILD